jgi:hypothetical protein
MIPLAIFQLPEPTTLKGPRDEINASLDARKNSDAAQRTDTTQRQHAGKRSAASIDIKKRGCEK